MFNYFCHFLIKIVRRYLFLFYFIIPPMTYPRIPLARRATNDHLRRTFLQLRHGTSVLEQVPDITNDGSKPDLLDKRSALQLLPKRLLLRAPTFASQVKVSEVGLGGHIGLLDSSDQFEPSVL